MSEPYCRTCNGWHYPEPVNPCPANQKGFVRPEKPRNPYKGTALEEWFPDIRKTPEQEKEWARILGKEYVEPVHKAKSVNNPLVHKEPKSVHKETKPVHKPDPVNTDKAAARKAYRKEWMAKKRAEKKDHDDK